MMPNIIKVWISLSFVWVTFLLMQAARLMKSDIGFFVGFALWLIAACFFIAYAVKTWRELHS